MRIEPVKPQPTFGILEHWHPTRYGDYKRGFYKGAKIEIYDAKSCDLKLFYVSDSKFFRWVKTKMIYIENGIRKIMRAEANNDINI